MAILGLMSSEDFAAERFTSIRRSVFYTYPNGSFPLIGLLSLLQGEELNDPEYVWHEKRWKQRGSTLTVNGTTSGPWYSDNSGSLGPYIATAASARTSGVQYWLSVTDNTPFREGDIVQIATVNVTGGTNSIQGRVTGSAIVSSVDYISIIIIQTLANVTNLYTDYPSLPAINVIGSAYAEGRTNVGVVPYDLPGDFGNYAQIFRTPFSLTGTAAKTSAKFDETGVYKDKAKEASIDHMVQCELGFLFGQKSKMTDPKTGAPIRTTGGIVWNLQQWESGSVYGNTAATLNTDDNKRIINLSNGILSSSAYDAYIERLFRQTNNVANEKLVLCGSGFLLAIQQMFGNKVNFNVSMPYEQAYGMKVVEHVTAFGTIYYRSHPLFTYDPVLRYNAMFLDVQNMRYRNLQDRDTQLLVHREPNDADYRQDEFLTEAGLEMRFPESCMYMTNVRSAA